MTKHNLFQTCILLGEKMYAFTTFGNLPVIVDLQKEEMCFSEDLEGYQAFAADEMVSDGANIYALELTGERLLHYNVHEKKCFYINLDCHGMDWDNYAEFNQYGNCLYIFPRYKKGMLKINVSDNMITRNTNLYHDIDKSANGSEDKPYFQCGCHFKNVVWLYRAQDNLLIAYDMGQEKWKKYALSEKIKNCVHMTVRKDVLYLLSSEGTIYCWNIADHFVEKCIDCSEGTEDAFYRLIVTDRKIYLLPGFGEKIVQVSMDTGEKNIYNDYPEKFQYLNVEGWSTYCGYCENEEYYFLAMRLSEYILRISKCDGTIKWMKPKFPLLDSYRRTYIKYHDLMYENELQLKDLLIHINHEDYRQGSERIADGDMIWNQLKSG